MSFADDLAKYCKAAGDKVEQVVRKSALELQAGMIERSPVDTGRFKGNFFVSVGTQTKETSTRIDKTPIGDADRSGALAEAAARLDAWKPGQTIFIVNNLPYAKRLEYEGWSKQAPGGMVRLTVQDFAQAVKRAVEAAK